MSKTHMASWITVILVFALLYAAFLLETGVLLWEYAGSNLAMRLATLDSQNFIFFPIAGLLAMVAFCRPVVLLVDAAWRGALKFGRPVLIGSLLVCGLAAWGISSAFQDSATRSIYEIAPEALVADSGAPASGGLPQRQPVTEILARMKILSAMDQGLSAYKAQCDAEWLQYSTAADAEMLCFPAGERLSVRDCCNAKADFRQHLNQMAVASPSLTARVHVYVMPTKIFFLLLLLATGILLVSYRKGLERCYGGTVSNVSFGLAAGGAVMLIWPLLNAAYLETISLLTGSGSSSAYTVVAPLVALGFGAWTLLLVFFHLRSYPGQIEYAARIGGFLAAAIGVFRYDEITSYLSRTLGVGGGLVAIIVFSVAIAALIISILLGIDPTDIKLGDDDDGAEETKETGA